MKKFLTVAFSAMAACLLAGNIHYANASVEASGDGLTLETAKKTIQEAVDLCATSGDTVKVAEGVYQDTNTCTLDNARAVVVITNKIHLVATGAKERTIIKGAFDSTSGNVSLDAVRGVYVYYTGSGTAGKRTANSIIKGFTVCNGATGTSGYGGGLSIQNSYAVNCIVSNCWAKYCGGIYAGTVVRCLVTGCNSTSHGAAAGSAKFINSILVRQNSGQRLLYYGGTMVNCTIAGNAAYNMGYTSSSGLVRFFNTIVTDNAFSKATFYNADHVYMTNCVISSGATRYTESLCANLVTNVSAYAFAAPPLCDWRPSAEMGAAKAGDAELLKVISLPADLEG